MLAGWGIERGEPEPSVTAPTADDLRELARQTRAVDLSGVLERYADAVTRVRDLGVALSDRRAVKVLKLVAAAATLCDRTVADATDLWVRRHVGDRAEQVGPLQTLVAGLLDGATGPAPHPGRRPPRRPTAKHWPPSWRRWRACGRCRGCAFTRPTVGRG